MRKVRSRALQLKKKQKAKRIIAPFETLDELFTYHFDNFSEPDHICRNGLELAIRMLECKPAYIVETGTSAWGTDSTRLFAAYVNSFGGKFLSVDIRPDPKKELGNLGPKTQLSISDSVIFLRELNLLNHRDRVDLLYLDSFDLDMSDPGPSMEHGLAEWHAARSLLKSGTIIVIDDTPSKNSLLFSQRDPALEYEKKHGFIPGKGALVLQDLDFLKNTSIKLHEYNLVARMC